MKSATYSCVIMLVCICCFLNASAQVKNYENQWKKVDELIQKKSLPKTALEEVKKIYVAAKKENQDAQIIKSLVYMIGLQQENRENSQAQAIKDVEKEIVSSKEPATSILKSLLAGLYWHYFQQYRWQLYERTNTTQFNKEDIATWTLEDFHKKISDLYLQSIKNEQILENTKLAPFDAIVIKGNVRNLRPTLFDLLAHRALDYFKNDERDLKKPAYAFEISQPQAFAPAAGFVKYPFATKDSISLQHKALLVYQDLIGFHLKDKSADALIDVDIDRIEFVYHNAVNENKDSLYVKVLEGMISNYAGNRASYQANYLLAAFYDQQASQYDPLKDSTHRYDRVKAKKILEEVVRDSAVKNEGWTNSYNLWQEISRPVFSFQMEKVNIPAQPLRALVNYKNVFTLYFRLVKADEDLKKQMERNDGGEKYWNSLLSASSIRSWQQHFPVTNDWQEHSVEIKVDALPSGEYFLLASPDSQFEKKNQALGAQLFYVSNISYVNQGSRFFVLHRETGQPLSKANVQVYKNEYDYKTYKYIKTKVGSYQTDKNGFFALESSKKDERNYGYFLDINYQTDRLALNDPTYYNYYEYRNASDKDEPKKIFFFTDRSIYRPGQTVYFKGIVVTRGSHENTIAVNYPTTLYLRDVNFQITDSLQVTTNEFGSFNGKFQLPQNLLSGYFQIVAKDNRNSTGFSVEEYKRPKFFVDFEKIKKSYKVEETVTVTAFAKAYAGNTIDGARVAYRVVRQPRYIYLWLTYRWWFPPAQPMEIAHGETVTDKDGRFTIQFTAIPDRKIDRKLEPVFDYKVYADVTDINGETRSGENTITAGYKSLLLKVALADKLPVDSLNTISIRTENMNGEYQPSTVTITATRLIPENRLIRSRFWQQPDQFVLSKEEFIGYFPHDEYRKETDYKTWSKGNILFTRTDSTRISSQFNVSSSPLAPGYYEITITTKDKDGQEIKDVHYLELFDAKSNQFNKPDYLWTKGSTHPIEPGENTTVQIGSSASQVFVVNQVDKGKMITDTLNEGADRFQFTTLNQEKKTWTYTAIENDRGGYGVNFFFVKDNRFYQFGDVIQVPWSNKELAIEYATFRDKTLPGSEEKWKVKITGYKNEKVAAEMLASMYDASLDQFKPHNWDKPGIWPVYAQLFAWSGGQNFSTIHSQEKYLQHDTRSYLKNYDQLLFYPANYYSPLAGALRGRIAGVRAPEAVDAQMAEVTPAIANKFERKATDTAANQPTDKEQAARAEPQANNIQPRRNFNETAFFFPELRTDKNGSIEFSFTVPEALTEWKLQTLVHTKDLALGLSQKELVTQKELMAQPNAPRFLRQGDQMEFTAKIVNLSDKEITGQAQLELMDAATAQSVDGWFINSFPNQYFTVGAGQSEVVRFPIQVPYQFNNALTWRVTARAGNLSDGEENTLPVLTNKILVTETLPLPMRGAGSKSFSFDKLLKAGESETLQHQSLAVEYTSNPAWYAVQALPYLMDYPYECAEQIWNRYYANALASKIVNTTPRIKQLFEQWKTMDTSVLLSNLQKDQELKSALLEETPWVLQAQSETQQKKNIALLFDMVHMSNELKTNLEKLKQMQSPNGGFVWFKGGPDDRYITQYIVTGIGHLKQLGVESIDLNSVLTTAIPYLDKKIKEDYEKLVKGKTDLKKQPPGYIAIQYLYMRSFFPNLAIPKASKTAYNYYQKQAQTFWMKQNKYMQGMIALAAHRTGARQLSAAILRSLKETALTNEEMGMYWKDNRFGYGWFWWYAPIETQALLIEAFSEIGKDTKTVDDLKTWLIKNKQTNNWRTTKATADACYALLQQGTNWLTDEPVVQIKLGNTTFSNTMEKPEAGTGYFKKTIEAKNIKPQMGTISVTVQQSQASNQEPSTLPSWGAVYWQYFEDMDKITTASTPLQLNKKLFIEKNTDRGPVLIPVEEGTELHVGDKLKVRIELRVDRDMEYVHMKDMRASALEPVNVLSSYKWQGGLGYYESTKDASTHFFFNYLRKGTYIFEYPLFTTHTGTFSNGITTIQCMYAPEFSAHSEGIKIRVE